MPTSLVTGGAGFLGSHLCDYLMGRGHRVICVDNLETGSLKNIEHVADDANFRFLLLDITEHYEIDEPLDFVFHMASPASPIDYARLPLHTLKVGAYGTHNSLGLAKAKRARFLLASTSEVYGDPLVHPQPESYWGNVNPIGPRGVYDEAKRYAEALTMAYLRQQGVNTCIARIFNTFGPRMRPNDGRAIPAFLGQALSNRPLTVFGDGSQTRSFCYVDDLIRGLVLLAESDVHEPVNIGNPDEMSPARDGRAGDRADRHASRRSCTRRCPWTTPRSASRTSRAPRQLLGWEPEIDVREGLRRTIEIYTEQLAAPDMSSSEAKNLEAIVKAIEQHDRNCEYPAVAVAMNPFEVERLGWDTIRGLPIHAGPQDPDRPLRGDLRRATSRSWSRRRPWRRSPSRRFPSGRAPARRRLGLVGGV